MIFFCGRDKALPCLYKMFFRDKVLFCFYIIFFLLFSCSNNSGGEKNPCDLCNSEQTCLNNKCVNNSNICGEYICLDTQTCINNICYSNAEACGRSLCNEEQTCINEICIYNNKLCGNQLCSKTQTCLNDVCIENSELCGGIICSETQNCIDDICLNKPVLCGENYCENHEICIENICKKQLTFATYNLCDLTVVNAYSKLAKYINDNNIDILVVQEIQPEDKDLILSELNKLNISMAVQYSSYGGYSSENGNDWLAVFSKYKIENFETILNETYQDPISKSYYSFTTMRPVIKFTVNVFGNPVTVFSLHLKAESPYPGCTDCINKRRAQAFALESYIKENFNPENDKIIIAGDANTATDADFVQSNTLDILTLKSDNPTVTENDFTPVNYTFKNESTHTVYYGLLDHIILSPQLMNNYIENSIEVITPYGIPSDHKSVLLKLEF